MSDLGFSIPGKRFNLLEALARPAGFQPDSRFGGALPYDPQPAPEPQPEQAQEEASDPVADAFSDGFAAGYQQAQTEAHARMEADAAAQQGLMLSFTRLDATLEEELRLRLRDTVAALCETALAPLALDPEALTRRIERAVSMLARADDDRVIHLHPDDIRLVSSRLTDQWQVEPDPRLERGTIRIENPDGGVEDGPATWRLAISEALHQC
jgi:flagellar assembly protein FliH